MEVDPFPFFKLNINTTVEAIMRDHGMEKDSQCRTGGSAASCSQAEKRPLNNNILINAPLPCSVATGSDRWRDYWELEREVTEQGPLLAPAEPPFTVCFRCVERVIQGLLETLRALRPSWSPPSIKAAEAGGPLTGNCHQKSKTHSVTSAAQSHSNNLSFLFLFPFFF